MDSDSNQIFTLTLIMSDMLDQTMIDFDIAYTDKITSVQAKNKKENKEEE